ncbi:hypothetical protein [Mariniblastus fucicola]|uniref:Uncharacterized protein n=1 Tax=Mariniblastus fucicola TaxID=980251 RepID=A0A5B9PJI7_9BACT|nr:hypothetical protein [Mariniblastus fucicola]QEG24836.1 hypothetical protein MFFC18_47590 [Mariniblastus fucicola]
MKPTAEHTFPDADVLEWRLTDSELLVRMSDVFYDGHLRGEAQLRFPLLRPASAMQYDHESNAWSDCAVVEPLKDLCEFHFKMRLRYSLKGFGRDSGQWVAVSVHSDNAEIVWDGASVG